MNRTLLRKALDQIQADKEKIIQDWESAIHQNSIEDYTQIIDRTTLEDWIDALLEDAWDGTPDNWDNVTQREANRLVAVGVNEDFFRIMLGSFATILWNYAVDTWSMMPNLALAFLREANIHIIRGRTEMAGIFLNKRLDMIKKQQQALIELSTPVIPLLENILIVPLIGTIDTARANQIMENILYGITERDAEFVIIDITGVPVVDSTVARHLIKAYQASRLLGAKCIMVGVRPEVAQTIVHLEVPFEKVDTKNNLAQGIEYALQLQGRKIVDIPVGEVKANGHSSRSRN